MENIFDYIRWRGDLSMESAAFNELDSLVLARLSYAPFDEINLQATDTPITVKNAANLLLAVPDIQQQVLWKYDVDLLSAVSKNTRFCGMTLSNYVNLIDAKTQMQFSAVAVRVADGLNYISFRGTDNTLIGWKEDFNMSFMSPVPAQEQAVEYLEHIAPLLHGDIILGGHSKGGNLAVYAAAFCRKEIQDRLISVYNFDGPGFDEKVLKTGQYRSIRDRAVTFVPQSSIVGMLLEHEETYTIVKSAQKSGFMQHDIYSWEVERDHFLYLDQVTNSSRFIDQTLKKWVADMDAVQRETLIDTMYDVVAQTNANTFNDMEANWFDTVKSILSSTINLDDNTRKLITQAISLLIKSARESIKDEYGRT